MNIKELVERLSEIAEDHPDAEVRLAVQPGYPLTELLRGVAGPDDYNGVDPESDDDPDPRAAHVWLVSGGQPSRYDENPYAPAWVFEAC
jgi:hypothetical protein